MKTSQDKDQQSLAVGNEISPPVTTSTETEFVDNSPEALEARKLQEVADNSPEALEMQAYQDKINEVKKKNTTGIPDNIKDGIEKLSGISLDDVTVHYNSSKPAEFDAHAYAEGTDVYIGPGQEEHLPHELWHVIQQKQGKTKVTKKINGKGVDGRKSMENEATKEGDKALKMKKHDDNSEDVLDTIPLNTSKTMQRVVIIDDEIYNSGDEDKLRENFPIGDFPNRDAEIISSLSDFAPRAKTLDDILSDPRTFKLSYDEMIDPEYGDRYWQGEMQKEGKGVVKGGTISDAGEKGALVECPGDGFAALKIAGLIQCVGIVIEAKDDDGLVVAAVGGHFVTPGSIEDGSINERGVAMIDGLKGLISEYNGLTFSAQTMVALGDMEGADKSRDYLSGRAAEVLIRKELGMEGDCNTGSSERVYKLNKNGTSSLE